MLVKIGALLRFGLVLLALCYVLVMGGQQVATHGAKLVGVGPKIGVRKF